MFLSPFNSKHVISTFFDKVGNLVWTSGIVFHAQFLTRAFGSNHTDKQHVVAWKQTNINVKVSCKYEINIFVAGVTLV